MLGKAALPHVTLRRVACADCGSRMESVSWLVCPARLTRRLADGVSELADLLGLHSSTVRLLDQRRLKGAMAALPPPEPRRLVTDEFALHKGHRYASVVLDAETPGCCGSARVAAG